MKFLTALTFVLMSSSILHAQTPSPRPTSNLSLSARDPPLYSFPALVRTHSGELVYTLTAKDFTLTDNGVEQKLSLEEDSGSEPLALVVAIQTGGAGARQFDTIATSAPWSKPSSATSPTRSPSLPSTASPTSSKPSLPT